MLWKSCYNERVRENSQPGLQVVEQSTHVFCYESIRVDDHEVRIPPVRKEEDEEDRQVKSELAFLSPPTLDEVCLELILEGANTRSKDDVSEQFIHRVSVGETVSQAHALTKDDLGHVENYDGEDVTSRLMQGALEKGRL